MPATLQTGATELIVGRKLRGLAGSLGWDVDRPSSRELAIRAVWSILGSGTARVLALASSIIVGRLLGKTGMGEMAVVLGTANTVEIIATLGLGITTTKFVAQYRTVEPRLVGSVANVARGLGWASGVTAALGFALLAPLIANNLLASPDLTWSLRIVSASLPFTVSTAIETGILGGLEAFRVLAKRQLLVSTLSIILIPPGIIMGGVAGASAAVTLGSMLGWFVTRTTADSVIRECGITAGDAPKRFPYREFFNFAFPAYLAGSIGAPITWITTAMLVNREGGYAEMGALNAASSWQFALLFLPNALASVFLPALTRAQSSGDPGEARSILRTGLRTTATLTILPAVVLSIFGREVMGLYGPGFDEFWPVLVLVLVAAVQMGLQAPVGHVIVASGRMWTGFAMNTGWAVILLLGSLYLVRFGAVGLATARLIAYSVHSAWVYVFALRLLKAGGQD
jgi:O-antigen/teichoic acid export membrane protein